MKIKQFDVKTAFLNGELDQEIYMKYPKGFEVPNKVLKLKKSLYGLKQAARIWNKTVDKNLNQLNFHQAKEDNCLYVNKTSQNPCYLIIHVDDILIASKQEKDIDKYASELAKCFELKCLGEVKQILGNNVKQQHDGSYALNQSHYIMKIAQTFQMEMIKGSKYPIDPGYFKLESPKLPAENQFRKIIGMLLYVASNTRPDISAAVGILSQKLSCPRVVDLLESKRIIRYLKETESCSLILGSPKNNLKLHAHSDADWAEDKTTRKSRSGFIIQLGDSTISWSSRRQDKVSVSTTESEFYALTETMKELIWIKSLLRNFEIEIAYPIRINIDSQPCIKLAENEKISQQTKHIDVRYHFAKEEIVAKNMMLCYIPTNHNVADMLTKPLAGTKTKYFRELANVKESAE